MWFTVIGREPCGVVGRMEGLLCEGPGVQTREGTGGLQSRRKRYSEDKRYNGSVLVVVPCPPAPDSRKAHEQVDKVRSRNKRVHYHSKLLFACCTTSTHVQLVIWLLFVHSTCIITYIDMLISRVEQAKEIQWIHCVLK